MKASEIFINNLRRLMADQKMSQNRLAQASGVSQPQISGYLRGEYLPGIDALDGLASAFGVSVSDLFQTDKPPTPRIERTTLPDEIRQAIREEVQAALAPQKSLPPIFARLATLNDDEIVALTPMLESIIEGALSLRAGDKIRRENK